MQTTVQNGAQSRRYSRSRAGVEQTCSAGFCSTVGVGSWWKLDEAATMEGGIMGMDLAWRPMPSVVGATYTSRTKIKNISITIVVPLASWNLRRLLDADVEEFAEADSLLSVNFWARVVGE
jgi:hypothetical protein